VKTKPKKFHFVEVNPQPSTSEEAEDHLRAFAESFIDKTFRDRWLHIMLEKPKKAE
jgi:3-hydroxyacyl-CoA dehydrogenase